MASDWTCCCICHDSQRDDYCPHCERHHSIGGEKLNSGIVELKQAGCPDLAIHNKRTPQKSVSILDAILGIGLACVLVIGGLIYVLHTDSNPVNSTEPVAVASNDGAMTDTSASYIGRWHGQRYLFLRNFGKEWLMDCRLLVLSESEPRNSHSVALTDEEFNKYFRVMFGDGGKPIFVKPFELSQRKLEADKAEKTGSELSSSKPSEYWLWIFFGLAVVEISIGVVGMYFVDRGHLKLGSVMAFVCLAASPFFFVSFYKSYCLFSNQEQNAAIVNNLKAASKLEAVTLSNEIQTLLKGFQSPSISTQTSEVLPGEEF